MANFSTGIVVTVVVVYAICSKILLDKVYSLSKLVVDEEFHLPLGQKYCKFNFYSWDPKVTTLPGLYLISALLLGPFQLCSIHSLRMISWFFSCMNLVLFYVIFSKSIKGNLLRIFSALTINLLPPLFFFSQVYYTDVVSLTSILLLVALSEYEHHFAASIAGFVSIIFRQTNVVIVLLFGGKYVINEMYTTWNEIKDVPYKEHLSVRNFKLFLMELFKKPVSILKAMQWDFWVNFGSYTTTILCFICFVVFNGSIVVGDKTAHQLTINLPQIFYFSLFFMIFAWPHFMGEAIKFLQFVKNKKFFIFLCLIIGFLIVHFNTQVHPYLLADNRHLTFYIWNRFYHRYFWFRYSMVPIYMFSLYVIVRIAWNKHDIGFGVLCFPAILVLLATQKLIEPRYFLVPYILLRLRIRAGESAVFNVVLEFITYCIINMIVFKIFFTKVLFWDDMLYPQRIIW